MKTSTVVLALPFITSNACAGTGVKEFLVERGMGGQQVATTSRGEMDAKGTNESSWAQDRRVDVRLAN